MSGHRGAPSYAVSARQLITELLKNIAPYVVGLHGEEEQATAIAGFLPLMPDLDFLLRVVVGLVGFSLVLHHEHPAIGQLGHEVGVEVIRRSTGVADVPELSSSPFTHKVGHALLSIG